MNKTFTDLHNQALTMGEHIEQMREAYEALELGRDALVAGYEDLRKVLIEYKRLYDANDYYPTYEAELESGYIEAAEWFHTHTLPDALERNNAQSLNHIKAQVEEETIERHIEQIRNKIDSSSYDVVKDALEYIAELLEVQPRKYAKQAGSTVEEGE